MATIMRVRTVFQGVAGAPYYSNHYFTDDATLSTAQDAIDAVDTFWTALSGNLTNAMTWNVEGTVARIDDVTGALNGQWAGVANAGVGGSAGEIIPRVAQGLVRWLTPNVVGGRMLRGRTFIPGVLESINTVSGVPTAAFVTLLATAGNALIADAGNELRVWSRTHGVSHPATAALGWTEWASLRSRRD